MHIAFLKRILFKMNTSYFIFGVELSIPKILELNAFFNFFWIVWVLPWVKTKNVKVIVRPSSTNLGTMRLIMNVVWPPLKYHSHCIITANVCTYTLLWLGTDPKYTDDKALLMRESEREEERYVVKSNVGRKRNIKMMLPRGTVCKLRKFTLTIFSEKFREINAFSTWK